MKLRLLQLKVTEDKTENLKKVENFCRNERTGESDFLVLPEMFNCPYEEKRFDEFSEEIPGPTTELLSDIARDSETYIVGGSIPEKAEEGVYNTSVVFGPGGDIIGKHRKVHLFRVDYPGKIRFDEAKYLKAGDEQTVVDTDFGKIGVAICYDLRFPELLRSMTQAGSKIIFIPAAFNTTTGPAHWKPVLRARAIDNQVFVVAASPARNRDSSYRAYGHSLIADPWGEVLAEAGEAEATLDIEIDPGEVEEIRKRLPLLESLRPEVYGN